MSKANDFPKGYHDGEQPWRPEYEPDENQVQRGSAALFPFVDKWKLPLNPEQLDLMAYAVIKHVMAVHPVGTTDFEAIIADVNEMIDEDMAGHRRMMAAQANRQT